MPIRTDLTTFQADANTAVIVLVEHLGDIIACEPVIRYLKTAFHGKKIAWILFGKYAEILEGHPDLDFLVEAESLEQATEWANAQPEDRTVFNLHFHSRKCSVTGKLVCNTRAVDTGITKENYFDTGSLLEVFCAIAGLPRLTDAPRYHFPTGAVSPELPEHYVVIHCKSNDLSKDWRREEWLKLHAYFAARHIHVVEIGTTPFVGGTMPYYIDMTHNHSLTQIACILKQAQFFFGIESGFAHLANAMGTDGIVIKGAFTRWARYHPYTGRYGKGKSVEPDAVLPARFVAAEKVLARYENAQKGIAPENLGPETDTSIIRLHDSFPNKAQRLVLRKLYRPLVRRFASKDYYLLFWDYPLLYLRLDTPQEPFRRFFLWLLRMLGPVPATLTQEPAGHKKTPLP